MKKWIIRPHRSSPNMLAVRDNGFWWTRDIKTALKFDERVDAVKEAVYAAPGEFAVMEIECP